MVWVVMLALTGIGKAQNTSDRGEGTFEETKHLVDTGDFTFVATSALSNAGSSRSLTTNENFLKIKGNQIAAHLPYFGESRFGTEYPGGGPILIEGVALEYSTQINERKRRITIKLSVQGKDELHQAILIISGSGFAKLTMRSMDRTRISYTGQIMATAKTE